MRHEKAELLLRIARDMQGLRSGLSLSDIASKYTDEPISRRTAERLRDALERLFGQYLEEIAEGSSKRWRLKSPYLRGLVELNAADLATLEVARKLAERDGLAQASAELSNLQKKIRVILSPELARRLEPDIEALTLAEGLAMRPGPHVAISPDVLRALRVALQSRTRCVIHYRYARTGAERTYTVNPLGLLYGVRHYLAASRVPSTDPKLFVLGQILKVDLLDEPCEIPKGFSMEEYARKSFGVFQEKPFDVHWRFKPNVADRAREYVFHPSQTIEDDPNGGLHVRFRAGSCLEMAWHLRMWGDSVEVLAPKDFWRRVKDAERRFLSKDPD